jgi:hypothetical protein
MYVYDEYQIKREKIKRYLFTLMNSLMYVIIPIIIGFLKINKNIISIWLIVIFGILKFYLETKKDFVNEYEKEYEELQDFEEILRKEKLKKKIFYLKMGCVSVCLIVITLININIFQLPSYVRDLKEIRKIISNSKELYVNGKKLENTGDVKKWILDSTNYFEILWDYKRADKVEEPKIKTTLSNEKGQYLVIEKKDYGWSFLKMKENHYYKLDITYKKDVDRTIEIEKSLELIPQN